MEIIYNIWFSLAVITTNISLIKLSLGFVPSIFGKRGSCYEKERPTTVLSLPKERKFNIEKSPVGCSEFHGQLHVRLFVKPLSKIGSRIFGPF